MRGDPKTYLLTLRSIIRLRPIPKKILRGGGGRIAQWLAFMLPDPAALGLTNIIHKKISEERNVHFAEVYQWCCLDESGLWLEIFYRTHISLTIGKLALQISVEPR